jgi:hypothetical protein
MRFMTAIGAGFCSVLLFVMLSPNAQADEWNQKTIVTFKEPVEIPGHVLLPGTYVFKLMNSDSDRNIVEVQTKDEQHLVAIVMTDPVVEGNVGGNAKLTFERLNPHSPDAIQVWSAGDGAS